MIDSSENYQADTTGEGDREQPTQESLNQARDHYDMIMPKMCPKCLGSGLQGSVSSAGKMPSVHHAKCFLGDGKGWLPDDSKVIWIPDYK